MPEEGTISIYSRTWLSRRCISRLQKRNLGDTSLTAITTNYQHHCRMDVLFDSVGMVNRLIGDNGCIICLCELRVSQRFSATCLWTASCSSGVNRTTFNAILMIQKTIPRIFGTYFASNFLSSLQSQIVSRSKSDEVLKSYRLCLLARRCSATRSTSLGSCQHRWHWVLLAATTTCCALKEHNMLHIRVHIEYFMRSNANSIVSIVTQWKKHMFTNPIKQLVDKMLSSHVIA